MRPFGAAFIMLGFKYLKHHLILNGFEDIEYAGNNVVLVKVSDGIRSFYLSSMPEDYLGAKNEYCPLVKPEEWKKAVKIYNIKGIFILLQRSGYILYAPHETRKDWVLKDIYFVPFSKVHSLQMFTNYYL